MRDAQTDPCSYYFNTSWENKTPFKKGVKGVKKRQRRQSLYLEHQAPAAAAERPHGVSVMQRKSPVSSLGPGSAPGGPRQQRRTHPTVPVWYPARDVLAVAAFVSLILVQVVYEVVARLNIRIYCHTSYTIY